MFDVTDPKIEDRKEQPYVGIRSLVKMQDLGSVIPQQIGEVAAWLNQQGVKPDGPPIVRYHTCPPAMDAAARMDILVGWPVAAALNGTDRITADTLPAGRYASLIYTGVENGYEGNGVLVNWGAEQGIHWDSWEDPKGEGFAGRVEYMLDGPDDDPDPGKWKTEVAIKLADK
jgi:effector-binding domain-containing protein